MFVSMPVYRTDFFLYYLKCSISDSLLLKSLLWKKASQKCVLVFFNPFNVIQPQPFANTCMYNDTIIHNKLGHIITLSVFMLWNNIEYAAHDAQYPCTCIIAHAL